MTTPLQPDGTRPFVYEDLGIKLWDKDDFQGANSESMGIILNSKTYCPKNKDYHVTGNYVSNNYTFVGIYLQAWNLTSGWKSATDVQNYIASIGAVMTLVVVKIYFNKIYNLWKFNKI